MSDFYQRGDQSQLPNLERFLSQAGTGQGGRDAVEKATFDRMFSQVQPQFKQQREQLTQNLINRGIPIGSQAYNDAMNRMEQQQNRSRENFALTATREGGAEQSRLYQLLSSGRGQLFGEESRLSDEAARQRGQQFGEGSRLYDESAGRRAQLFGEGTQRFGESAAQRAQMFGEDTQQTAEAASQRGASVW